MMIALFLVLLLGLGTTTAPTWVYVIVFGCCGVIRYMFAHSPEAYSLELFRDGPIALPFPFEPSDAGENKGTLTTAVQCPEFYVQVLRRFKNVHEPFPIALAYQHFLDLKTAIENKEKQLHAAIAYCSDKPHKEENKWRTLGRDLKSLQHYVSVALDYLSLHPDFHIQYQTMKCHLAHINAVKAEKAAKAAQHSANVTYYSNLLFR